jgi:hypothetical protein
MRACAAVQGVVATLVLCAAAFAACSNSPPAQPPPSDAPAGAPGNTTAATAATPEPAGDPGKQKEPETVADCKDLRTEITNDPPDGGVVMNNANTAADAGSSDRFNPIVDQFKAHRNRFRCCFDIWAKKNPGAKGHVNFTVQLDPKGGLKKAFIKNEGSDIRHPDVESCMVEVVKGITFPASPSGKDTDLTYPFDFKARN